MYAEETQYPRREQPTAEYLLFFRDVFHYISDLAAEDTAEGVDGVGTDAFVAFEPGDLCGADIVLLDERVLADALFLHHFP